MYNRPRSEDRTPGQMLLRKLFVRDAGRFLDRLQAAEREYRKGRAPESGGEVGPVVEDVGADAVDELLRKLLRGDET